MTPEAIAAEKLPVKGPVEILCEEIGHPYDASLARVDVFVAFVEVLVAEISDMIAWRSVISRGFKEDGFNTLEAMKPLKAVQSLVKDSYTLNADEREERCAELHNGICDQPDDGPCNRFIEMLSSCVSALRFGLEIPCRSRHAAEASNHIWKHKYGVTLFDEHTTRWQNDWAVSKFKQALELRGICYRPAIAQAIKDAIAEATPKWEHSEAPPPEVLDAWEPVTEFGEPPVRVIEDMGGVLWAVANSFSEEDSETFQIVGIMRLPSLPTPPTEGTKTSTPPAQEGK